VTSALNSAQGACTQFSPLRIRRKGFFLPNHTTVVRRSGEQMLLAASRSGNIDPMVAASAEVFSLRIMLLYYGPSADLQPHLLGSTNSSSARGNAHSTRPLAGYAAALLLAFFISEGTIGLVMTRHRSGLTFFFIFFLSWSFQTSRMTSGYLWSGFPRTLRNVGSLVVCALVAYVRTAITAGGNGWYSHGYEQPRPEFVGAI